MQMTAQSELCKSECREPKSRETSRPVEIKAEIELFQSRKPLIRGSSKISTNSPVAGSNPYFSKPLNNLGFKASTKLPCHFSRSSGRRTKKVRDDKPLTCGFGGRDDRIRTCDILLPKRPQGLSLIIIVFETLSNYQFYLAVS